MFFVDVGFGFIICVVFVLNVFVMGFFVKIFLMLLLVGVVYVVLFGIVDFFVL